MLSLKMRDLAYLVKGALKGELSPIEINVTDEANYIVYTYAFHRERFEIFERFTLFANQEKRDLWDDFLLTTINFTDTDLTDTKIEELLSLVGAKMDDGLISTGPTINFTYDDLEICL